MPKNYWPIEPIYLLIIFAGSPNMVSPKGHVNDDVLYDQQLIKDLLDHPKYDKRVRPVHNSSSPIKVTIRFNLYQILDVYWKDEFLGWDPEEYGGINKTVLPFESVWLPDTYLYNSLQMTRESSERWINVIVRTSFNKSTGESIANIQFQYPAIFKFSCKMDIAYFPFDIQNCTLLIGSWTHDSSGLDYYPYGEDVLTEAFVPNEEWDLLSFKFTRSSQKYLCCPHPYTWVNAHLVIQRKPLYYLSNLVFPTVIICIIAVVGFFMPASTSGERTEKVNLGITTLLAMAILLLMVSDTMPTTSNFIPLVGWFYLSMIVIISLGTFMTSLVILVHQQGHYGIGVPKWVRVVFFEYLAKLLWLKPQTELAQLIKKKLRKRHNSIDQAAELNCTNSDRPSEHYKDVEVNQCLVKHSYDEIKFQKNSTVTLVKDCPHLNESSNQHTDLPTNITSELGGIQKSLRKIEDCVHVKERHIMAMLEWDYLARILDRFFLFVFLIATLATTLTFLLVGKLANQLPT